MTARTDVHAPTTATTVHGRGRQPRRALSYAGVVALGLALLVLLALTAGRPTEPLDPESPGRSGAMALVQVLSQQGVTVEIVRSIGDLEASRPTRDTTVVVGDPTYLGQGATERLAEATRSAGRLVLVGVDGDQLDVLGLPVTAFPGVEVDLVARCTSSVAVDSDVVWAVDTRYLVDDGAEGASTCFTLPSPDSDSGEPAAGGEYGSALVEVAATPSTPATFLVGFGPGWSNQLVAEDSHAGTAVRALGSTPRLVWYHPGPGDLDDVTAGAGPGIWPLWTTPVLVLLGVAVLALALARGRRLGRLVPEPLPVVVRAIETTEGRGRLYRRAGDPARAATVLRAGTADRLARRLAVPRGAGAAGLVPAVSRATGHPAVEVAGILFGPPPPDDAALIRLAQQLTDLEERAHHP
ncbi:MAG TPA: DUF4350 domain-containing protein [Ornithinibacter sp.]|nr:DUF4350 domain-containing protein [Ornithinibacter sp.]